MDRYEFSDGKSHKFWAAQVDGSEVSTQWGRIGTMGQSKTKSLASPDAADKELAKLVRSKVKKGYVLVAEDMPALAVKPVLAVEAAKPTKPTESAKELIAPSKPSAPSSALPDESLANIEGLAKHMPPVRGGVKASRFLSLDDAWKRFRANGQRLPTPTRMVFDEFYDGLGTALDGVLKRQWIAFPAAAKEAGLRVAQFDHARFWGFEKAAIFDVLLATGGAPYALLATVASLGWAPLRSANQLGEGDPGIWASRRPGVVRLREVVCGLDDADYAAALEAAAACDVKFFSQRLALAYIFPEETAFQGAALADIRAFIAGLPKPTTDRERGEHARLKDAISHGARLLLVDLEELEDIELISQIIHCSVTDMLVPLRRIGAKLTPMVMKCATDFGARGWTDKSDEALLAKLLVATPSDEPIDWLIAHMDRVSFSEGLSHAAKFYPVRVLTRLGPVAIGRGNVTGRALLLITQIQVQYPSALGVAKAVWDDNTRNKVEKLLAESAAAPAADHASLPKVFTEPRWTKKRAKSVKSKALELRPLEHKAEFKWPAGTRELWLRKRGTDEGWGSMNAMATATDEVAAMLLKNWKAKDYYWADGWEQPVIARFEQGALRIVRSMMTFNPVVAVKCALPFGDVAFALPIADAYSRLKSARKEARAWLLHHPEVAFVGLIPAVMGSQKKSAESARRAITLLVGAGHGDLLIEVAARYGEEATARAEELSMLDALDDLPKKIPPLPAWTAGVVAPELKTGGSLPREALDVFVTMLAISKPGDPYAGVEVATDTLTGESLARFSWSLFETWRLGGMDSKQGWAFHQLGLIGDDECARKLTPILRKWPGEGGHARATQGLDILAELGSDVALMNLLCDESEAQVQRAEKEGRGEGPGGRRRARYEQA